MTDPILEQNELKENLGYLRRLEKMNNFLARVTIIAIFTLIGSFSTILSMFPLKEKETVFVSVPKGEHRIVKLVSEEIDSETKQQWVVATLYEYIEKRETINFVDEDLRYSWLQGFTHPDWFKMFASQMSTSDPNSPLRQYSEKEMMREISVISVEYIPDSNSVWRIEYVATDRKAGSGKKIQQRTYIATLKAYLTNMKLPEKMANINPFGLIVENYSIQEKGKGGKQ